MKLRNAFMATMATSVILAAGCEESPPPEQSSSSEEMSAREALVETEYSAAELARRAAAIERLNLFDPHHLSLRAEVPVTRLTIARAASASSDMSGEDLEFILVPFLDELESLALVGVKLEPEVLDLFATMPNLKRLDLAYTGLKPSDFKHLAGSSARRVTLDPEAEPVVPWMTADEELVFGEWATSEDGNVSMRVMVEAGATEAGEPLFLYVELRNNTTGPLCVSRPFLRLWEQSITIDGPNGPIARADSADRARRGWRPEFRLCILQAEGIYRDRTSISPEAWPGSEAPGRYELAYKYTPNAGRSTFTEERVHKAMRRYGMKAELVEVWRGEIQSPSIAVEKR